MWKSWFGFRWSVVSISENVRQCFGPTHCQKDSNPTSPWLFKFEIGNGAHIVGARWQKDGYVFENCRPWWRLQVCSFWSKDVLMVFLLGCSGYGRVPQLSNMGNDCLYISDGVGRTASPNSLHGAPLQPYRWQLWEFGICILQKRPDNKGTC